MIIIRIGTWQKEQLWYFKQFDPIKKIKKHVSCKYNTKDAHEKFFITSS